MIIAICAVLGVILGSFVNALVWRLHEQAKLVGKKTQVAIRKRHELSILKGRSMCPHCGHELAAKDLVPVLSWLSLWGKCRYCRAPISVQYPLVELLTGLLFGVSYVSWPHSLQGLGWLVFAGWLVCTVLFVALAVYDLHWFTLPDRLVWPLTALAGFLTLVGALQTGLWADLYVPLLGGLLIFGIFWVLYQISAGKWLGGGDVKLAFALGLLAGSPAKAGLVLFGASLIGTCISLPSVIRQKRGLQAHIPFGPYLLLAAYIAVLYGDHIIDWYQGILLP